VVLGTAADEGRDPAGDPAPSTPPTPDAPADAPARRPRSSTRHPSHGPGRGPGHGPARGEWPPFTPGNLAAARHGSYSPRIVDPLARELVERVLSEVAYLAEPSYATAVWAWARAEARVALLTEYVEREGLLDRKGNPRPALNALTEQERLATLHRQRLGLDPLSRVRLGRDVTAARLDLARFWIDEDDGAEAGGDDVPGWSEGGA
jgi:hypothetical protein